MKRNLIIICLFFPLFSLGQSEEEVNVLAQLIKDKKFEQGYELSKKYLKKKKNAGLVYYYKAVCEQSKGSYKNAMETADKGLEVVTKSDTLFGMFVHLKSWAKVYTGDIAGALVLMEGLSESDPTNWKYLVDLSYLYGENLQFYNCLKVLKIAYQIDSLNNLVINNLAYYNTQTGDYESAIFYAKKGLDLDLTNDSLVKGSLYNSLGISQAKTISYQKGLETIKESMKYFPGNPYAYFNIGLIYLDQENPEEACRNFKIAQELGGTNISHVVYEMYCE